MATLPTLNPSALVSSSNATTTTVGNINDSNDATFIDSINGNGASGNWIYEFDDTPADLGSMTTFSIVVRSALSITGNDTWTIRAYLVDTSGAQLHTPPTAQAVSATTVNAFTFSPALISNNTKSGWDNARILIEWTNGKVGAFDNNRIRVHKVQIDGTYATGTTYFGGATVSSAATVSATGFNEKPGGTVAISSTATVSATGYREFSASASVQAAATVSSAALKEAFGSSSVSAVGSVSATGFIEKVITSVPTINGTVTVTATGDRIVPGPFYITSDFNEEFYDGGVVVDISTFERWGAIFI